MSKHIYSIPSKNIQILKHYIGIMNKRCPNSFNKAGIRLNESKNVLVVEDKSSMSKSHASFFESVIKKIDSVRIKESFIEEQINLLEKVTKSKVKLVENNEGIKNLAVEALNTVSDNLNMLKQNIQLATEQVDALSGQDLALTKLRGLSSIIDSAITDISEIITNVTSLQTEERVLGLEEAEDEKGFVTSTDNAIKNIDKVSKIVDKGKNIILDDNV